MTISECNLAAGLPVGKALKEIPFGQGRTRKVPMRRRFLMG